MTYSDVDNMFPREDFLVTIRTLKKLVNLDDKGHISVFYIKALISHLEDLVKDLDSKNSWK